jgi:ApaG protein
MVTALTKGIKISVDPEFLPELTDLKQKLIYFKYHITIENQNDFTVQLLYRKWVVFDTVMMHREIAGEGVVGKKPIIYRGGNFTYQSGCEIYSEFGYMKGYYDFAILDPSNNFVKKMRVGVPLFKLEFPPRLN